MSHPQTASPARNQALPVPPASSRLAQVIQTIFKNREDARVEFIHTQGAGFRLGDKAGVVLFVWDEAHAHTFPERLKSVMQQRAKGMLVVGLLGGSNQARQMLKKARPMMTKVKVGQFHIDEGGDVWTRDASFMEKALNDLQTTPPPSPAEWSHFLAESTSSLADSEEQAKEAQAFFTSLQARRPVATYGLLAIILAVFGLEHLFGGTQSSIVLLRMGALDPDRVLAGEYWRLFSCTFLHAGFLHLLFNSYVLWVIGSFLERLIGTWRFLLLYGLSCLGASLTSLVFLEGFSVGASGGLWGLLGAEAVLAWRSQGLLPRAMIDGARRAAKFNLGINVLNSFRPQVDMWAHFGGGAVGAALILSGWLTRGLPRLGELESQERLGDQDAVAIPTDSGLKLAGGFFAAILLVGLAFGLGNGQPWKLQSPVELVQTPVPEFGISLALPKGLEQRPDAQGGASIQVGDLTLDLGSVVVTHFPGNYSDATVLERELTALLEQMKTAPPEGRLISGPEEVSIAGNRGALARYAYKNGIEEEIAFVFLEEAVVKADTLRWPAFQKAVPPGYAAQVLDGLEPLSPASDPLLPPED